MIHERSSRNRRVCVGSGQAQQRGAQAYGTVRRAPRREHAPRRRAISGCSRRLHEPCGLAVQADLRHSTTVRGHRTWWSAGRGSLARRAPRTFVVLPNSPAIRCLRPKGLLRATACKGQAIGCCTRARPEAGPMPPAQRPRTNVKLPFPVVRLRRGLREGRPPHSSPGPTSSHEARAKRPVAFSRTEIRTRLTRRLNRDPGASTRPVEGS